MSFKSSERLHRGIGVPFWPSTEAEWELWHARNAAAVAKVKAACPGDADMMLDMLGLLPEQLSEAEERMRSTAANSAPKARPQLLGHKMPAQNRNS